MISVKKTSLIYILIITFAIKMALVGYFQYLTVCATPSLKASNLSVYGGDTFSYFGAMENYIQKNEYFFLSQHPTEKTKIYAGRMPHYTIPYYVLRQFFSSETSFDIMILIQILLESISILLLSMLVVQISDLKWSFWICWSLMMISTNVTNWAYYLLPESICVSFLVFFAYQYYQYLSERKNENLYYSSIFLAILCVMKPYFVLIFIIMGIDFICFDKKIKIIFTKTLLVSIPFLLLITPWIIRNYMVINRFVPFQETTMAGYWQSESHQAMNTFLKSWGGNTVFWETKAPSYYFLNDDETAKKYKFPAMALTKTYSQPTLDSLRVKMLVLQKNYSLALDKEIALNFKQLTTQYVEENPFNYYLTASFIRMKDFVFHSGSYYLPISKDFPCYKSFQFLIKISQSLLYYLALLGGFIGLFLLIKQNRSNFLFLIIPVYLLLFFPFVIKSSEWRFFIPAYPFLILGLSFLVTEIKNKIQKIAFK